MDPSRRTRATDSDLATATMHAEAGQLIGTLAYMSPEQCAGSASTRREGGPKEPRGSARAALPSAAPLPPRTPAGIDTRTDVYSLGVVLFELLTDRLPYDVSYMTITAATRVICEQEPPRPSSIALCGATRKGGTGVSPVWEGDAPAEPIREGETPVEPRGIGVSPARLRGDLDTIILKCLEKDRARRYNSAAALAEDIERYLRGEPIAACPPTRGAALCGHALARTRRSRAPKRSPFAAHFSREPPPLSAPPNSGPPRSSRDGTC